MMKRILSINIVFLFLVMFVFGLGVTDVCSEDQVLGGNLNPYPVPDMKYKEQSFMADIVDNHFFERLEKYVMVSKTFKGLRLDTLESWRVNAFDEVPDSNMFTNRNGRIAMDLQDIATGPNVNDGPDMANKWTVIKGKASGVTPGFLIDDSRGDRYLIKLDRNTNPEMLSSCEVIATKIFHAIGYNVPQNTIEYFKLDQLQISEGATYRNRDGFIKPLALDLVKDLLENSAYKDSNGNYRAIASKYINGIPKGYVSLHSSRKEDKFDTIPHQHRREMRGYRIFSSWLNHHDARRGNSLDVIIQEKDGWYLKHYLIDFGACLGSHNMMPKYAEAGHTYIYDLGEVFKSLVSLGFYKKPYYKDVKQISPCVGYFTADDFKPKKWKPMIPNYAFDNMTDRDAFWAAKIVMSFTDEQLAEIVKTADYSDPNDAEYVLDVLIKRRDVVGAYWFSQISPLDNFIASATSTGLSIAFENLYEKYGFLDDGDDIEYLFYLYEGDYLIKEGKSKEAAFILSNTLLSANKTYRVKVVADGPHKAWKEGTIVSISSNGQIVGIERV